MKNKKWVTLILGVALAAAASMRAKADTLFDNSSTRANPERFQLTNIWEAGEEIVLAGNGTYTVTNFQFEYFAYGPDFTNGNATIRLRFYANDGALGVPGTMLYDSTVRSVSRSGPAGNVLEYDQLSIVVPKNFTWSVQFGGLTAQSSAGLQSSGLDLYTVPTIGLTYDDMWEKSGAGGTTWVLRVPTAGQPRLNFGARVLGTYLGPAAITVPPSSVAVCPGATAVFGVTAIGTPPLTYRWRTNGVLATGGGFSGSVISLPSTYAPSTVTVDVTAAVGPTTPQSAPAALTLQSGGPVAGLLVYDNSTTRANPEHFATANYEFGDEIILAGSGTWNITDFRFEYFGRGPDFTANRVFLALRFYLNDGIGGRPNTLIFDSGFTNVQATPVDGRVLDYTNINVSVPKSFTWTVEFAGLSSSSVGGLQAGGLDLYGPPTVGNNYDDYWEKSGPGLSWVLRAPSPGFPAINFGARAEASVTGPPVITKQPQSRLVCRGDSATLSVTAIGSGTLTYQWYQNLNPVNGATNASYTIPMTDNAETGNYTVIVGNCLGSVNSQAATLAISNPFGIAPCLKIRRGAPGFAIVSWTAFYGPGWVLQETPTLNPPPLTGPGFPWVNSGAAVTLVDAEYSATVPTTGLEKFYRLRVP